MIEIDDAEKISKIIWLAINLHSRGEDAIKYVAPTLAIWFPGFNWERLIRNLPDIEL